MLGEELGGRPLSKKKIKELAPRVDFIGPRTTAVYGTLIITPYESSPCG